MMKEIFKQICQDSKLVGSSCVIVKDGKIVEELNYGFSSLENKTEAKSTTVYRIASISKVIVAMAVLKLYEDDLIDLDADISTYLGFKVRNPYFPNDKITIRLIMTQNSSLTDGNEDETSGYNFVNGTNLECSLQDLLVEGGKYYTLDTFDQKAPGTHFIYSNFNCGILACIVEKVSGRLFTDFVRQEILMPMGVDASFRITDIENPDIATTYLPDGEGVKISRTPESFVKSLYHIFPLGDNFRGPAGGLFISMRDLSRLMNVLMNHGYPLLKSSTIEEMLKTQWEGNGDSSYKAKGLQVIILNFEGKILKGHFGDAYGVKSFMLFNETKQLGICYITNGGHYHYQASGICDTHEKVIRAFLEKYWI
jgi:CubicO group peptidase (beta-lactamase class C family)